MLHWSTSSHSFLTLSSLDIVFITFSLIPSVWEFNSITDLNTFSASKQYVCVCVCVCVCVDFKQQSLPCITSEYYILSEKEYDRLFLGILN
jgi:hypothetical protein